MSSAPLRIIHRDDLPEGGFAGIVETRMAMSPQIWRDAGHRRDISHGMGDFIYLASGYFKPHDGAPLHPHEDVDIVSVILSGAVGHKGTLGDGTEIAGPGVQVQRAGTGMQHAEFNLGDSNAEIIQIWFRPPAKGLPPAYRNFELKPGEMTTVLGSGGKESFDSTMRCQVGSLNQGQSVTSDRPFVAMITSGSALANGIEVSSGDLIEGQHLSLSAQQELGLVLIQGAPH